MELQVAVGVKNPLWVYLTVPANVVTATTKTAADISGNKYDIDSVSSTISPVLTPVVYTSQQFTRSLSTVAGHVTLWSVSLQGIQNTQLTTTNGNIILYFPRLTICMPTSGAPVCTITISADFTVTCTVTLYTQTTAQVQNEPCQSIKEVQFSSICATAANCNSMTSTLNLKLSSIRNYLDTSSLTLTTTNYFGARINNLDNSQSLHYQVSATNSYTALSASPFHSFTASSNSLVTGNLATYTFTLNPN